MWSVRLGEGGGVRVWGVWADGENMMNSKLAMHCMHTHVQRESIFVEFMQIKARKKSNFVSNHAKNIASML